MLSLCNSYLDSYGYLDSYDPEILEDLYRTV